MDQLNIDAATVEGFGKEWKKFKQNALTDDERMEMFAKFFPLVDWTKRPKRALDMGCGSGRWDVIVAPLVDELVAADASAEALDVAMQNVKASNVTFVKCTPDTLPFPDETFDLIFSIGVLHHLPDTQGAIESLVQKLKPGGLLTLYLYYSFDNMPTWYRWLWRSTNITRYLISGLPWLPRYLLSQVIAGTVYWPIARVAKYFPVPASWPLRFYANRSFYIMRTDALDRFGTRLEKRFTKRQIEAMLAAARLENVTFSAHEPYWVCAGSKRS